MRFFSILFLFFFLESRFCTIFVSHFKYSAMGQLTEEEKVLRRIMTKFGKGVTTYGLIEEGDRILIGLSGGKDSLALLELLARRSRIFRPRFSVVAVHVRMSNIAYESDTEYLRRYAESWGVPFISYKTSFDASTDHRKSPCFLCSWNRRKALFTVAKEQGCNKIALGHHMDDILQTLLMNMTFQGSVSTMPPKLVMRKFDMTIIRPMCLIAEADLQAMAQIRRFRRQVKNCPYEKDSHRSDMKEVLALLERMNPEARFSLWSSMSHVQTELLPEDLKSRSLKENDLFL